MNGEQQTLAMCESCGVAGVHLGPFEAEGRSWERLCVGCKRAIVEGDPEVLAQIERLRASRTDLLERQAERELAEATREAGLGDEPVESVEVVREELPFPLVVSARCMFCQGPPVPPSEPLEHAAGCPELTVSEHVSEAEIVAIARELSENVMRGRPSASWWHLHSRLVVSCSRPPSPAPESLTVEGFGVHVTIQASCVDGVPMVDIDTLAEDEDEPELRIFVNDGCIHEHPALADVIAVSPTPPGMAEALERMGSKS